MEASLKQQLKTTQDELKSAKEHIQKLNAQIAQLTALPPSQEAKEQHDAAMIAEIKKKITTDPYWIQSKVKSGEININDVFLNLYTLLMLACSHGSYQVFIYCLYLQYVSIN